VLREEGEHVVEGALDCAGCGTAYPVIDGVPLLLADLGAYGASGGMALLAREDLDAATEDRLGAAWGPGSAFDVPRQHLSIYAWDHYGELDPEERGEPRPGSAVALLAGAMNAIGEVREGPAIDLGCSVGRTTFELAARTGGLVLGVDLSFPMLRLAARVLRSGRVRYPRRRVGLVYDRRDFPIELPAAERVDFWACDAANPPFAADTFATAAALNVLDCVPDPRGLLGSIERLLAPGGIAVLSTPYDWSPQATPPAAWLGARPGAPDGGASEPALQRLLATGSESATGLELIAEDPDLPWRVRLHDRSSVDYRVHLAVARARKTAR
jgi:SAM-dependent methyltransferase